MFAYNISRAVDSGWSPSFSLFYGTTNWKGEKKACPLNNNNKRIILTQASYCEQANDIRQVGPLFPMWCSSVGEEHVIILSNGLRSQMSPRCAFVCFVSFLRAAVSHGAKASNTNTENVQEGADPAGLQGYLILREYEGSRCYEQAKGRT